jgi:hypothetical protein
MSQICGILKTPGYYVVSDFSGEIFIFRYQRALISLDVERLWCRQAELKVVHKGPASLRPRCDSVVAL